MLKVIYAETESAIQFNPASFDDDDLDMLETIIDTDNVPIQLRAPIGCMVATERRRRAADDPELVEAEYCALNITALGRRELAATLGGAFTLMFARGSMTDRVSQFVSLVGYQVCGLAQARIEIGWAVN